MKRIIIVNNNLHIGGVQKSLINLINEINGKYDLTLYLFAAIGEYIEELPSNIKIIEAPKFLKILGLSQRESKKMGYFYYFLRGVLVLYTGFFGNSLILNLLTRSQRKIGKYDCAISFLHTACEKILYGGCNEFVLNCIDAKQKISFIHCDFLNYRDGIKKNRKIYSQFDKIAACSEGCLLHFKRAFPEFSEKSRCVRNCQDYKKIISYSNIRPVEYEKDYFNVITVSRVSAEKGIKRAVEVVKRLLIAGFKIKYHIIGDGNIKIINDFVHYHNLESCILFYGNQKNPYRYMKNADLFLLPSYHEAAPMVIDEAKCLGLPILATETTSTKEMIINDKAGWVCANSTEAIENSLKYILENRDELLKVRELLKCRIYDNTTAVNQFDHLIVESATNG